MSARLIVVTGLPRTGTTFVERSLAGLPNVIAPGEPFHGSEPLRTVWARQLPTWQKTECPLRWLDQVRREHVADGQTLLIKVLLEQLSAEQFAKIIRSGETIVCERDPLDTLVSLKQAQASGMWNVLSDGRGMFGKMAMPAKYSPEPVMIALHELAAQQELHRRLAKATETLPWRIRYGDILENPLQICARLGEWLQMPPPAPGTRRVVDLPRRERIANWLEIVEHELPRLRADLGPLRQLARRVRAGGHVVEIGAFAGEGTRVWLDAGLCVDAIDPWADPARDQLDTGVRDGYTTQRWSFEMRDVETIFDQRCDPYPGCLTKRKAWDWEVVEAYPPAALDAVYCGAIGTYQETAGVLRRWRSKLRPGGLLCGYGFGERFPEVMRAVREHGEPEVLADSSWVLNV